MSEQSIKELQKQGFLLIKKIHVWLVVLSIVLAGIAQVVLGFNSIQDHEKRIIILEDTERQKHDLLNEIKYNLKNFIEANGQKYIDLK